MKRTLPVPVEYVRGGYFASRRGARIRDNNTVASCPRHEKSRARSSNERGRRKNNLGDPLPPGDDITNFLVQTSRHPQKQASSMTRRSLQPTIDPYPPPCILTVVVILFLLLVDRMNHASCPILVVQLLTLPVQHEQHSNIRRAL